MFTFAIIGFPVLKNVRKLPGRVFATIVGEMRCRMNKFVEELRNDKADKIDLR